MKKSEESLGDLCGAIKHINMHYESLKRRKEIERKFEEIMAKNFPNLMKEKKFTNPRSEVNSG